MRRSTRTHPADQRQGEKADFGDSDTRQNNRSIMASGGSQSRSTESLLLSVNETAALLGIHRATVYDLLASGQLRSTTLGRRRVIPRAAVEAFVAMLDQRAEQEAERQRSSG